MSDTEVATTNLDEERDMLRERAAQLGLKISPNAGVDSLRKKIAEALSDPVEKEPEPIVAHKTKAQAAAELRAQLRAEALALVRCHIANLDPAKNNWPGEYITVQNNFTGAYTKYIPFGEAAQEYHLPKMIYDELVSRKFQQKRITKNAAGHENVTTRLVPEYSVTILPPLTEDELEDLKTAQAASGRTKD